MGERSAKAKFYIFTAAGICSTVAVSLGCLGTFLETIGYSIGKFYNLKSTEEEQATWDKTKDDILIKYLPNSNDLPPVTCLDWISRVKNVSTHERCTRLRQRQDMDLPQCTDKYMLLIPLIMSAIVWACSVALLIVMTLVKSLQRNRKIAFLHLAISLLMLLSALLSFAYTIWMFRRSKGDSNERVRRGEHYQVYLIFFGMVLTLASGVAHLIGWTFIEVGNEGNKRKSSYYL